MVEFLVELPLMVDYYLQRAMPESIVDSSMQLLVEQPMKMVALLAVDCEGEYSMQLVAVEVVVVFARMAVLDLVEGLVVDKDIHDNLHLQEGQNF